MDEAYKDLMNTLNKLKTVKTREELQSLQAEIDTKRKRALRESEEYRAMIEVKRSEEEMRVKRKQVEIDRIVEDARRKVEQAMIPNVKRYSYIQNISPENVRERMKRSMRMIA
jgi:hypothetical protein